MNTNITRIAGITAGAAFVALALTMAAPAGANDPYAPSLQSAGVATARVTAEPSKPYTPTAAKKKATKAAEAKKAAKAKAAKAKVVAASSAKKTSKGKSSEAEAKRILSGLTAKYPILEGTSVSFGDARGHQAVAYYQSGRIIISPNHRASLTRILNHEIWHIIDYRDNGKIDWNESVPPKNAASFRG